MNRYSDPAAAELLIASLLLFCFCKENFAKTIDKKTWHDIIKVQRKLGMRGGIYMNREEILEKSRKENLIWLSQLPEGWLLSSLC